MKIMLICDSLGIGGAETHVLGLASGMCGRGHTVIVVAGRGELTERLFEKCGSKLHFFDLRPCGRDALSLFSYMLHLGKIIKRELPSVIHAHSRVAALALRTLRIVGHLKNIPIVVSAHAKYKTGAVSKCLSFWGDRCIAVSEDIRSHIVNNFGVSSNKVSVIPNGIDQNEYESRVGLEPYTVLFASRLDEDSSLGAECLCKISNELYSRYPEMKIMIAGGGSELETLKQRFSRAVFLGALPSLSETMQMSELIVGVSRVALEGMMCERNVLLFGNEGAIGLLNEENLKTAERSNFTCRDQGVKDESFLLDEICRFFDSDPNHRGLSAHVNRRYALLHHSADMVVSNTLSLYVSATNDRRKILIGGYYGFGNLGDDTILSCLLDALGKMNVEKDRICVLGHFNGECDGVRWINRYSPIRLIIEMRRSEVFILGGGSLLQDETSTCSLIYYCALIFAARALGCKCILLSNGIGPLKSRFSQRLASDALKKAWRVGLRDLGSLKLANALGCHDAVLGADLCFLSEMEQYESESVRRVKEMCVKGYVLVALKGEGDRSKLLCELESVCRCRGWTPVFVAMDRLEDCEAAGAYAKECGGIFAQGIERGEILSLLSDAEAVIGERLHFLIFSLSVGKGFVGIGNSPKVKVFTKETMGEDTVDPLYPNDFAYKIEKSRFFSPDALTMRLWEYRQRSKKELTDLEKAFFV